MAMAGPKPGKKDAKDAKGKAKPAKPAKVKEKPAKVKKAKKSRQGPGMKELLVRHADKLVVGLAVLIAGVIIYLGAGSESTDVKTPDELNQIVSNAQSNIRRSTWSDEVIAERRQKPDDFHVVASSELPPVAPTMFAMVRPWDPPLLPNQQRRKDPEFLPVQHLIVKAGSGPIAIGGMGSEYGYGPQPGQGQASGDDLDFADPNELGSQTTADTYDPNMIPMPAEMVNFMPGGRQGATGEVEGVYFVSITGVIPWKEQTEQYRDAFEEAVGFFPPRDTPNYVRCEVQRVEVFADGSQSEWQTVGYLDEYAYPELAQKRNWGMMIDPMQNEVCDLMYYDRNTVMPLPPLLNRDMSEYGLHPLVPRRDPNKMYGVGYGGYGGPAGYGETGYGPGANPDAAGGQGGPQANQPEDPSRPRPPGGMRTGGYGSGADGGYGYGPSGGYGTSGYGSAYSSGYGASGPVGPRGGGSPYGYGYSGGAASGSGYGAPYGNSGGYSSGSGGYGYGYGYGQGGGYSSSYSSGYSSGYGGYGYGDNMAMPGATLPMPPVDYKLFRYFDFTAQPGKMYRYRVRVTLEDPNFPINPELRPKPHQLEDDVTMRIQQKEPPKDEFDFGEWWVNTPWSEVSETVYVPKGTRVLVGKVTAPPQVRAANGNATFDSPTVDPKIASIVVDWDPATGMDIPVQRELTLGDVARMAVSKAVYAIDYARSVIHKKENYKIESDIILADVRGGERVGGDAREPLTAPGEVLLIDGAGQLIVRDEIRDMDRYLLYDLPDFEQQQQASGYESGYSGDYGNEGRRGRSRGRQRSGGGGGYGYGYGGQ